jgi:TRAP transporter TAXI family solute receptor
MRKWMVLGLALLAVASLVAAAFGLFAVRAPRQFRIASGPQGGNYYEAAQVLRAVLAAKGFQLQVIETEGSLENVALLKSGRADIAVLQGGTSAVTDTSSLQTLALVGYEPLWLFYNTLGGRRTVENLPDLRGLRVSIGAPGSGTQSLVRQKLALDGLEPTDLVLVEESMTKSAEMLKNGELDAAFFVTAARTPVIGELANHPNLALYFARRAQAVERKMPFVRAVTLFQGTFSLAKNIPTEDVPLIATRTAIVSREGFHPDLVRLVLQALPAILPTPLVGERDAFPTLNDVEMPANPDAILFFREGPTALERYLPFEIASPLSRIYLILLPLLVFAFPIWTLTKATFNWYMKSQIVNQYPQILSIERQLSRYTIQEVDEKLVYMRELDDQLSQKTRLTAGYLQPFYQMRGDVRYVIGKLEKRREELLASEMRRQPTRSDAEPAHDVASSRQMGKA